MIASANLVVVKVKKNYQKIFKSIKLIGSLEFFIVRARRVFTKLRQAFIKVLIIYYFDLKVYIWIETDVLSYVTDRILNQLSLDSLG